MLFGYIFYTYYGSYEPPYFLRLLKFDGDNVYNKEFFIYHSYHVTCDSKSIMVVDKNTITLTTYKINWDQIDENKNSFSNENNIGNIKSSTNKLIDIFLVLCLFYR